MSDIPIRVANLGKKYVLSHLARGGHKKYTALRDVLTEAAMAPLRRLTRHGANANGQPEVAKSREEFWALKDVSFEIKRGESVGIIGRNGAGKSTLLKLLSRITAPTEGRIELDGKVASLLEVGTGFHPELTGRENIYLNGAILGMKRAEIKAKFDEIVAFAEVEKFLDTPVKHYSSGMYVRLAFAVAAHLEPDVLIVDEVLAVGDAEFQKKCLGKMQSVSENEGRTVLFVSHNMQAIRQMCQRVIFLRQGQVAYQGSPHEGISAYLGQGTHAESQETIELADYPRTHPIEDATFLRVRFANGRGEALSRVKATEVLAVEVDIAVKKPLRQFNLAMAVVHGEGLRVFSEAYSDEHPMPDLAPGEYRVCFHVPMRFFKMESYFLVLAMNEAGKHCDQIEGLLMPEIFDENPNVQMENLRWGVLRVPVTWDVIQPVVKQTVTGEALMKEWLRRIYQKLPVIRDLEDLKRLNREQGQLMKAAAVIQALEALKAGNERYRDPKRLLVHGAQYWSQNWEDGMIAEIFRRIGTTSRTFLEIGVGTGAENNTTVLLSDGWKGWWIDGDTACCEAIHAQLRKMPKTAKRLKVKQAFVSPDNIHGLLAELGVPGEIDLFSLDIDLNTYHIWAALADFGPRVVVVEYNAAFPPTESWIHPLRADGRWDYSQQFGASLKAFELLGTKFGYSLVGCDVIGLNAFFVRNDLLNDSFHAPFTSENHYEPPRYHLVFRMSHRPIFFVENDEQ